MPLTTSGTYDFQGLENDELITECFERLGIEGEQLTPAKLSSARRSLNLLLLDWINKSVNLWTNKTAFLSLIEGKSNYTLDKTVIDVKNVNFRDFTRCLSGNPTATSGNAANAFDDDPTTACTQDTANGSITYTYPTSTSIQFIGIVSHVDAEYALTVSSVGALATTLLTIPKQNYIAGEVYWFDLDIQTSNLAYSIAETDGATLNIREIYLTNNVSDIPLASIDRDSYLSFLNKTTQGRPSVFYLDKQIEPILNLWQTPSSTFKVLHYSYLKSIQEVGGFYNIIDIPARLYPSLVSGLTWMLSTKFNPEISGLLKEDYETSFAMATANDVNNVDMSLHINLSNYYD